MNVAGNNIFINQNVHIVSTKISMHLASQSVAHLNEFKTFSDNYQKIKVKKTPKILKIDEKHEHNKQVFNEVAQEADNFHDILI
jgi:hypothetical protein